MEVQVLVYSKIFSEMKYAYNIIIKTAINRMHPWSPCSAHPTCTRNFDHMVEHSSCALLRFSRRLQHSGSVSEVCSSVSFVSLIRLQHCARVNVVAVAFYRIAFVLFSSCMLFLLFSFRFYFNHFEIKLNPFVIGFALAIKPSSLQ